MKFEQETVVPARETGWRDVTVATIDDGVAVFVDASGWEAESVDLPRLIQAGVDRVAAEGIIGILYNKEGAEPPLLYAVYSPTGELLEEVSKMDGGTTAMFIQSLLQMAAQRQ